jgi:hypothetical protein
LIETGCAIEKEELNCYFKSYLKRESFWNPIIQTSFAMFFINGAASSCFFILSVSSVCFFWLSVCCDGLSAFAGLIVYFGFRNNKLFIHSFIIKQSGSWDIDNAIIEP